MPPAGPQAQGWTGKCKSIRCQCLAQAGIHPLAIGQDRSQQTWPRGRRSFRQWCAPPSPAGAKPATRRVADGERMNPREQVARPRRCRRRRAPGRRGRSHPGPSVVVRQPQIGRTALRGTILACPMTLPSGKETGQQTMQRLARSTAAWTTGTSGAETCNRQPHGSPHTCVRYSTGIRKTTPQKGTIARGQAARSSGAHQALSCTSEWCTASVATHPLGRPR